jgi:uncharacterized repeat protein (TIGR03803 family)
MTDKRQIQISKLRPAAGGALAFVILLLFGVVAAPLAQAQTLGSYTFSALYDFTGGSDGGYPAGGLIEDSAGNLYGTASSSASNWGNVFEVSPGGNETVLYSFCADGFPCVDGGAPESTLLADSAGNLYGTASFGGTSKAGVVFELSPAPAGGVCPSGTNQGTGWCESVLYSFTGGSDGSSPASKLIVDSSGNLYGTTEGEYGVGTNACGSVFELIAPSAGGTWTEQTLHDFAGGTADGCFAVAGLVMDSSGSLYGVTVDGGANGVGMFYKVSPGDGAWTETVAYSFGAQGNDSAHPYSDLIFSGSSLIGTALYGGKSSTGTTNNGTVFQLTPGAGGTWTETAIYAFTGGNDGCNPSAGVTADPFGNLYGTTSSCPPEGYWGTVFELSPPASGNTWTETTLYDFLGDSDNDVDGGNPEGIVLVDSKGNLFGTTTCFNCSVLAGSVWELSSPAQPTTTTVTSTPNPSNYGESVTFTATISPGGGSSVRGRAASRRKRVNARDVTGAVSWSSNTGCGTTTVTSGTQATATCTTSSLNAGFDTVTAAYNGDANNDASKGTLSQTVTPAEQQITVTSPAPASAIDGSSFTVAATSTSGSPVQISTSGPCTGTGTSSATITMTSANTREVCDVVFFAAAAGNYQSASLTETTAVAKSTKRTVSFTTPAPATAGYQSTFTVTAQSQSPNDTSVPTMAVVQPSTGTAPCQLSGGTTANGTAVSATVAMTSGTGTCTVEATWPLTTEYEVTTAKTATKATKLIPVIAWPAPAAIDYGTRLSSTQLDATASSNSSSLTGKFVYSPASGKVLAAGTQTLTVKFTPSTLADYAAATGSTQLVVNPIGSTTTITKTVPASPTSGQTVTVYFSVAAAYGKPTGSVTVSSDNGGPSCTGTLTMGKGTCTFTFASSGFYTLTGAYSGDNNDNASTSSGYLLAVQ